MKTFQTIMRLIFATLPLVSYAQNNFVGQITCRVVTDYKDDGIDSTMIRLKGISNMQMFFLSDGKTVIKRITEFGVVQGRKFTLGQNMDTVFSALLDFPGYQRCFQTKFGQGNDTSLNNINLIDLDPGCVRENTELEVTPTEYESDTQNEDAVYFDEYRDILGYRCQKAIVTDETGAKTTVFFTPALPPLLSRDKGWKQIKGLVLYYQTTVPGAVVRIEASNLSFDRPAAHQLLVPAANR